MKLIPLVRRLACRGWWAGRRRAGLVFLCVLVALVAPLCAQAAGDAAAPDALKGVEESLDHARVKMDQIQKSLKGSLDDDELVQLRLEVQKTQTRAETAVTLLDPLLTSVKARQAELGPPPTGAPEAPDVAAQRAQLTRASAKLDSQIKLARLISVEAGQAVEQIQTMRRSQFQARLGERTDSILGHRFWAGLHSEWPRDLRRVAPLTDEAGSLLQAVPGGVLAGLSLAILVVFGLWVQAGRLLMRLTTTRVPPGRLRRSLFAAVQVLLAVVAPGLIAWLLRIGLSWPGDLSDTMDGLLGRVVGLVCFGGVVAGLGHALLAPDRPTWRLPAISDSVARGLRWHPLVLAVIIVVGWLAQHLSSDVNAGLSVIVAIDCANGLLVSLVLAHGLARAGRLRHRARISAEKDAPPVSPLWLTVLGGLAWAALVSSVVCILVGYVAFGSFLVRQVVWVATVLSATYLLTMLIDDGCSSLLAIVRRKAGETGSRGSMLNARSQALVLLSGLSRVAIVLFAITLLLIPFGEGPSEWMARFDQLYTGISIGEAQIRPSSVLLSVLVLVFGFFGVKVLQRWLLTRYLPTTSLDAGMQLSASTLFGYAGYVLIVALSLSAAGIGLERVAWIASALSVGIGFGLQAVVQNFVSGLILLAERPVKVGDWVSLSNVEGDIRRINVRATEIQMWDRSTVVVPNSEFITKIVRNVTHANPLGRVQIRLPMPVTTDAEQARALMLGALADHPGVLDEPTPSVLLDGIEGNSLMFVATGYVGSPRLASGIRSDLLFDILGRLRQSGLTLSTPTTMLLGETPPSGLPAIAAVAPTSAD
jgi:small-conductance mechanosensitive channel